MYMRNFRDSITAPPRHNTISFIIMVLGGAFLLLFVSLYIMGVWNYFVLSTLLWVFVGIGGLAENIPDRLQYVVIILRIFSLLGTPIIFLWLLTVMVR